MVLGPAYWWAIPKAVIPADPAALLTVRGVMGTTLAATRSREHDAADSLLRARLCPVAEQVHSGRGR